MLRPYADDIDFKRATSFIPLRRLSHTLDVTLGKKLQIRNSGFCKKYPSQAVLKAKFSQQN